MKPRVTLITLAVDDLEKAVAFYRDGLGFPTKGIVGGGYAGYFQDPDEHTGKSPGIHNSRFRSRRPNAVGSRATARTQCGPDGTFELQQVKADADWVGTRVGFDLEGQSPGTQVRRLEV